MSGLLDPDEVLGDLLIPFVSASVAIVLFEGGLNLNLRELRGTGRVVWSLVTIGAAATWGLTALAAYFILGMDRSLSLLVGAILVVTGPTVIGPLLRHVRPVGRVASVLRWEGILIDPVGALLAVLVFEGIVVGEHTEAASVIGRGIFEAAAVGTLVGAAGALAIVLLLKRYLVPDFLHSPFSLALVLGAFVGANLIRDEAGLVAVVVMGMVLANQRWVPVKHIIEFKEALQVLLISGLFIVLAARLELADVTGLGIRGPLFLLVVLAARPVAVYLSTVGSKLPGAERRFLSAVAPRGIVAAAIASVFALRLRELGHPSADLLAPVTFTVIIGTIAIYSSTASAVARRLGLADADPQGALIVGAHPWARAIATALRDEGFRVLLVDTDRAAVTAARLQGLDAVYGSALSEHALEGVDLNGIGRLLALTSNDELNSLATQQFAHVFGRAEVYQLPPRPPDMPRTRALGAHQHGRLLFASDATFSALSDRVVAGASVRRTRLTDEFDFEAFQALHGEQALPMFVIAPDGKLGILTAERKASPRPGDRVISLVTGEAPSGGDGQAAGVRQAGSAPASELRD